MSNPIDPTPAGSPSDHEDTMSAMFASLVIQQANMASIFLGLTPHPQTGQVTRELDHAKYFIDLLEMLEAKTKGNLDPHEQSLLRQSLTSLRFAFVDAVSKPEAPSAPPEKAAEPAAAPATPPVEPKAAAEPPSPDPAPAAAEESRKKFTKKY